MALTTNTNLCISDANTATSNLRISTTTTTVLDSLRNTLLTTTIPYDGRIDMGSGFDLSNLMVGFIEQSTVPKVKKVETYNGKVVKVIFGDGTFEKAVCDSGDTFNVDVGITICILKKMLGKDGHKKYNKLMKDIHKLMQKQVIDKAAERQRKEAEKRKAERAKEKAMQRKEKAREEYIETHVEVMRRYNSERLEKK